MPAAWQCCEGGEHPVCALVQQQRHSSRANCSAGHGDQGKHTGINCAAEASGPRLRLTAALQYDRGGFAHRQLVRSRGCCDWPGHCSRIRSLAVRAAPLTAPVTAPVTAEPAAVAACTAPLTMPPVMTAGEELTVRRPCADCDRICLPPGAAPPRPAAEAMLASSAGTM